MIRMASVGDNVVDRYHDTGLMYPGGGAANVAVHASRSGFKSSYIGVIGSDEAGDHVLAALREEGVDVSRVRTVDAPNSATDVALDNDANRVFVGHQQIASELHLTDDDLAHLAGCTWVYSSYSSAMESQVEALASAAPLAFDFSYKSMEYAADLLPSVTVAAFSRDGMGEEQATSFIEQVQGNGPEVVVVTRGAAGVVIGRNGQIHIQAAQTIEPIDTLGAGDAFLARFVNGIYSGETTADAAAAASVSAGEVCLHYGAFGHPRSMAAHGKEVQDVINN